MKQLVLRLDHIFGAWPVWNANLSVLRVSTLDFDRFVELSRELRRPVLMRAPVECGPELPAGDGVAAFDTGHVVRVRIEWSEL